MIGLTKEESKLLKRNNFVTLYYGDYHICIVYFEGWGRYFIKGLPKEFKQFEFGFFGEDFAIMAECRLLV